MSLVLYERARRMGRLDISRNLARCSAPPHAIIRLQRHCTHCGRLSQTTTIPAHRVLPHSGAHDPDT
eukprot:3979760-Pyramimonas_sp.AAC.1